MCNNDTLGMEVSVHRQAIEYPPQQFFIKSSAAYSAEAQNEVFEDAYEVKQLHGRDHS